MSTNGHTSNLSFRALALWLRAREFFTDPRQRLVDAGLEAGQVVLDYGCGVGSYALPAARIVGDGGKVFALDIHPQAVEAVGRRARSAHMSNVETIQSDLGTGLASESVDVVLLYDVLHAVPDQQALLQELHRILKPGGRLSVHPDHMTRDELLAIVDGGAQFVLQGQQGEVFAFTKRHATSTRRRRHRNGDAAP
jgi:2-polyprenyl-3-methyl-5-hydroxy-6-metoxy-1,4-benzoquinol methylase